MPVSRLRSLAVLALWPFLSAVSCGVGGPDFREATVHGSLGGAQMVPPVETGATGRATAEVFGDLVSIQGTFSDLQGRVLPEDQGVLLRLGPEGENGSVITWLDAASVDGLSGTFSANLRLGPDLLDVLEGGGTYVEIRTEAFPEGELRGQLD